MEQFGLPKPQGVDTEVDRERLRWNTVAEGAKFSHLCSSSPNTKEMEALFVIIKNAIDSNLTLFIYIQGECLLYISFSLHVILTLIVVQVKPVLENHFCPEVVCICSIVRQIALGCAATALASQVSVCNISY